MKTRTLKNDAGAVTGFAIGTLGITRRGVVKVLSSIPGIAITRKPGWVTAAGSDDFCEFMLEGKKFFVIEPFGDSDEFWVVTEPPEECPQSQKVRDAFNKHRLLFGLVAG
jgi:hypothetical protein